MEDNKKVIDIEKTIRESKSGFFKSLPRFVIRLIIKLIRQEEFNKVIFNNRDKTGVPFLNGLLKDWNVDVEVIGDENIPAAGRFIFASNHPVGGNDALSLFNMIYRHFPVIVSPANELLKIIPNIQPLMIGVNVFGKTSRQIAVQLNELYESDAQIMIFPAGEVSRRIKGKISDITWQKSFVSKAIEHRRDIIPVFVAGRNSNFFYFVANLRKLLGIKMYIETLLLPGEMMKQRNSKTILYIGEPIKYQTLTKEFTHSEWAQKVKMIVYSLQGRWGNL
jgi:putative hemolysin